MSIDFLNKLLIITNQSVIVAGGGKSGEAGGREERPGGPDQERRVLRADTGSGGGHPAPEQLHREVRGAGGDVPGGGAAAGSGALQEALRSTSSCQRVGFSAVVSTSVYLGSFKVYRSIVL